MTPEARAKIMREWRKDVARIAEELDAEAARRVARAHLRDTHNARNAETAAASILTRAAPQEAEGSPAAASDRGASVAPPSLNCAGAEVGASGSAPAAFSGNGLTRDHRGRIVWNDAAVGILRAMVEVDRMTFAQVSEHLGITKGAVGVRVRGFGIKAARRPGKYVVKWVEARIREVAELAASGKSIRETAEAMGETQGAIRLIAYANDIRFDSRSAKTTDAPASAPTKGVGAGAAPGARKQGGRHAADHPAAVPAARPSVAAASPSAGGARQEGPAAPSRAEASPRADGRPSGDLMSEAPKARAEGSLHLRPLPIPHTIATSIARDVPLALVRPNGCRWPTNDAAEPGRHLFCNAETATGRPYCTDHAAKAYVRGGGGWVAPVGARVLYGRSGDLVPGKVVDHRTEAMSGLWIVVDLDDGQRVKARPTNLHRPAAVAAAE